jgi:hypothetical protein
VKKWGKRYVSEEFAIERRVGIQAGAREFSGATFLGIMV